VTLRRAVLASVLALVVHAGGASGSATRPHVAPAAAEDIRLLVRELEALHPNPYHTVPRADFQRTVDNLIARLPQLDEDQVLVELMRLLVLGDRDGHSGVYPGDHGRVLQRYPLRLYYFADGLYVVRALGVPGAVGLKLVAIGGVPLADVESKVRPLVPADNDWSRRALTPGYLVTAEVLHGLRVIPGTGPITFTLESRTGERRDVTLRTVTTQQYDKALGEFWKPPVRPGMPPKRLPASLRYADQVRYITTINRGRAVYFAYNQTIQPTYELTQRLKKLMRDRRVKRLIVDVRRNGGGNNRTYGPLMEFLQSASVNRRGKLVVLIGRLTFSAAQNFINALERTTNVIFVGEPSGGSPNHYSDGDPIELPTLRLRPRTSTGYIQDSRPDDPRVAIEPHVRVDVTSADFMARRDRVLRTAVHLRG
jgi:Peptidase family S41